MPKKFETPEERGASKGHITGLRIVQYPPFSRTLETLPREERWVLGFVTLVTAHSPAASIYRASGGMGGETLT
jgi:hypothetical protein